MLCEDYSILPRIADTLVDGSSHDLHPRTLAFLPRPEIVPLGYESITGRTSNPKRLRGQFPQYVFKKRHIFSGPWLLTDFRGDHEGVGRTICNRVAGVV